MYARNGANGGEEAEGFKQENGYLVGTPGWSCTTLCGVEHSTSDVDGTFFPPSADQNQSSKHKNLSGSDFCSDIFSGSENTRIGLWIPRFVTPGMGNLDVQADRVTSNVIQLMDSTAGQSEKKKATAARKSKRSSKGSGTSSNKDLMEVYRISRPSGSKDRHSKVATAKGPRDRRMRLSVETAVKFFHVQDRLGFDQPSKAVEWLIEKCSSAIDELPHISHSESLPDFKSLSTPMNSAAELIMNCERDQRKRGRNSKLSSCSPNVKELKTKAKPERDQEGSKRKRRGQAKVSSEVNQKAVETMNFRQGLLHMHCHDLSGIGRFESRHKTPYFNCAQYSPEIVFQSYPSSSVQSAESFSGRDSTATTTTTFSVPSSCPFPRVMPSISIDPQSTISEF
ncbi:hypothetical protein SUGI_1056170 [Cryptomeria japonica]|uniref:transcription factor TCP12 n=1 Tax=Cryptomeria japonica TaxID=3369 RepID=UPI002414C6D5|nr:transcription factor TCP12 [Cryptomeria japonica]XP_057850163.1 transcription factor TCP12 [Cryptomeria japonica]XP_057850164.1 transcription factor TCP12 [Cryptomeria japonica]XP_057850166.1 transcription factor TCP12 [Cryptomeria japonica]XP_057850167.1 transcription factor TCP12 [Cryptomeria japonica]XP_057850168.1 transcription factor TCP12 [Cryptomeria japonica]XP_057850169.1 transcription factor TCP12 [Cryptomeria japonica]XP_057850170.1 transcription factor TCP12 [Cryptomeria japon